MGVYNCASTLPDALDCIINQTYSNWEIIVCDDGSKDNTLGIVFKYAKKFPEKIIVLKNEENRGLNYTLNKCLECATGEYIARMDGDDLCSLNRFEKEVDFLNKHSDIAIVSTDMIFFDHKGEWGKTDVMQSPKPIDLLSGTKFCHAACMVRKEAYDSVGGYSENSKLLRVEDYHLWVKMYSKGFKGQNLKEYLYMMRDDRSAQRRRKFKYRLNETYVRFLAVKLLSLPIFCYLYCFEPVLIGLLPSNLYTFLHRFKNN